jgi:hypothetical protein
VEPPTPEWEEECERIEDLSHRIREIGEDAAYEEYRETILEPDAGAA